ncbi:MAG: GGDEF domain-containing protein [Desulfobulbus sp.]|nr:GGDEF domain-containing protein [Desulfobulbus sp.]
MQTNTVPTSVRTVTAPPSSLKATHPPAEEAIYAILHSKDLPTLPALASKLLELTACEETTLAEIAHVITQDIALSTKILRVANSAFFVFPQKITSINQAVSVLGTSAVRSLVLSFSFLSIGKQQRHTLFNLEQFWERSLIQATAAKLISEQVPNMDAEEAFTIGLLQNIGKLVLAITMPHAYDKVLEHLQKQPVPPENNSSHDITATERELELRYIGATHTEVGYHVAKIWQLPENLLLPIRYHHCPDDCDETSPAYKQILHIAHLANILSLLFCTGQPERYHKLFRQRARKLLGLTTVRVNMILKTIDKVIDQSAHSFGLKITPVKPVAEILQEANLRLSLLNLSYEEMNRELIKSKLELERLTEELAQKNRMLENLANIDGLTEIHNHRYFQNFLESEINRSIRTKRPLSLLLADIDHFKAFNDTYGHQAGDFLLKEFCRVTKEIIREYDLIARYGGEEFAYVFPETTADEAMLIAEKIRKNTEECIFNDGVNVYQVTISIGVANASFADDGTISKNDLITMADNALYDAKNSGRNCVVLGSTASRKKKRWFAF